MISGSRQLQQVPLDRLEQCFKNKNTDFKIYTYWKLGRRTQKEIGGLFKKTASAISHAIKRFEKKMEGNEALKDEIRALEGEFMFQALTPNPKK